MYYFRTDIECILKKQFVPCSVNNNLVTNLNSRDIPSEKVQGPGQWGNSTKLNIWS